MAKHQTKEGLLTAADLATYGIPSMQPAEPTLVKSNAATTKRKGHSDETKHARPDRRQTARSEGEN